MSNEQEQGQAQVNSEVARLLVAEADLCYTLGIERRVLDALRGRGLPAVYLNRNYRVYLISEVVEWLGRNRGERAVKHGTN